MKNKLLLAVVIADVVFFGGWIARESHARRIGRAVNLPIEGYDPRDVLSGHYVRFRLVAEREADAIGGAGSYCLEDGHVTAQRGAHDECELFITRSGKNFGIDRYYIDERLAHELTRVSAGEDTYVETQIGDDGAIHVKHLVVDGNRY